MPRLKPPFPAAKGFWQKPTDINNVETLANVPWIINNGGAAFGAMGTEQSKGTKVFALAGKIKWSSSNSAIVKVNQKGKITAKKSGTATITYAGKTFLIDPWLAPRFTSGCLAMIPMMCANANLNMHIL